MNQCFITGADATEEPWAQRKVLMAISVATAFPSLISWTMQKQ
jgi:hypothetical protein